MCKTFETTTDVYATLAGENDRAHAADMSERATFILLVMQADRILQHTALTLTPTEAK